MGRAFIFMDPRQELMWKVQSHSFYCRNGISVKSRGKLFSAFRYELVFNWSAAKLCTIIEAIMCALVCVCLCILYCTLSGIIMLSALAYAWSAPQRPSAAGKIYSRSPGRVLLSTMFSSWNAIFHAAGIMSPLQFASFACWLGRDYKMFIGVVYAAAVGKVFPSIKGADGKYANWKCWN